MRIVAADTLAGEQRLDRCIQRAARPRDVREPARDPDDEALQLITTRCQMSEFGGGEPAESIRGAEAARPSVLQQLGLIAGSLARRLRVDRADMSRVMHLDPADRQFDLVQKRTVRTRHASRDQFTRIAVATRSESFGGENSRTRRRRDAQHDRGRLADVEHQVAADGGADAGQLSLVTSTVTPSRLADRPWYTPLSGATSP